MPKKATQPEQPAPTEKQKASIDAASARVLERAEARQAEQARLPRIEATWSEGGLAVGPSHSDSMGWTAQLTDSLGLTDPRVAEFLLNGAINSGFSGKIADAESARAGTIATENALAFVADMRPQNAVEAALVLQMAATHTASLNMARHAARAERRDALADYSRMMNQTMRTFTAQAEALHKLRTGGKQQVEVRYVYVDQRQQTLVAGGAGERPGFSGQPHGPGAAGLPFAPGVPVWGQDAGRDALSVASHPGAEAMPDARGQEPGRSEG